MRPSSSLKIKQPNHQHSPPVARDERRPFGRDRTPLAVGPARSPRTLKPASVWKCCHHCFLQLHKSTLAPILRVSLHPLKLLHVRVVLALQSSAPPRLNAQVLVLHESEHPNCVLARSVHLLRAGRSGANMSTQNTGRRPHEIRHLATCSKRNSQARNREAVDVAPSPEWTRATDADMGRASAEREDAQIV